MRKKLEKENNDIKVEKVKLKDRLLSNDITWSGPLSYRSIRIMAWICLAIAQIGVILSITMAISKDTAGSLSTPERVLSYFSNFTLPLFLMANFAIILQKRHNLRQLLILFGSLAALLYVGGIIVMSHFGYTLIKPLADGASFWDISVGIGTHMVTAGNTSFYLFNIFIDLFLCSLCYFLLHYKPKKYFQGKKLIIFRLFILLPILYEIGSIFIKYASTVGDLKISYFLFFLLTAKPPLTFLAFLIIIFVMKLQENGFIKRHNYDEKLYEEHTMTRAHAVKSSITMCWSFALCAILDAIGLVVYVVIFARNRAASGYDMATLIDVGIVSAIMLGIGNSMSLIFVAPLSLFFSYNKKHKNTIVDKLLPVGGIALVAFIYLEGFLQIYAHKLPQLIQWIKEIFGA